MLLKNIAFTSPLCIFPAVIDIGSAAFKYDMRRLSEILSFPKAWYKRNLARRLFLGDDSYAQNLEDGILLYFVLCYYHVVFPFVL